MSYKRISPQPVVEGGTGAQSLTDHAVIIGSGTAAVSFVGPVAATGAILASNGVGSDPGFTTATYPLTTTVSEILYSSATNTVSGLTTANSGVLTTGATGIPAITAIANDGQFIIGSTAGAPAAGTITSTGATITVTGGANTINIEAVNTGNVSGTGSSTDNALARWDGAGGDTLQDSTVIVSDAGEMTNGSQPGFSAYLGTTDTNVTGDGTFFVLGDTDIGTALTELFDNNGDFTPGASGGAFFTAPVGGVYYFSINISFLDLTSAHTALDITFAASTAGNFFVQGGNIGAMRDLNNQYNAGGSAVIKLNAAETVTFTSAVYSGSKTVDINGATNYKTYVTGFLLG